MRPGDWTCERCGEPRNFAARRECFKCGAPRPDAGRGDTEAEALAEENLVLQNRVYGTSHPNAAAGLELVGHVRAGLAAQAA